MATEQVLHMNAGDGKTSYAKNSLLQRRAMVRAKPMLTESVMNLYFKSSVPISCFRVADLGCSSGPNALMAVATIIAAIDEASRKLKVDAPHFQIFFNDLFGNDFNSLLRLLPQFYHTLLKQEDDNKGFDSPKKLVPKCFANATPGSFYGRLFPTNSIHFFHSSYSVHWVSQVPKRLKEYAELEVDDEKWNNDYNYVRRKTIHECYFEQFNEDFRMFLRSRSEELVSRGAMLLTFIGSYEYDTSESITAGGLIHTLLTEMVSQNLIQGAKLDGFTIPMYHPKAEEVKEIIKEQGSFSVERMESMRTSWDGLSLDEYENEEDGVDYENFVDDNERGKSIAKYIRAVTEPILKAHFGQEDMMMDELFLRFENKVVQLMPILEYPIFVISLVKNA